MVQSALTWKLFFNRQHQGEGFALFTYLSDLALGALLLGFSVFPITSRILVVAELCVTIFYFWVISFLIWVWVISLLSGYPFSLFRVTPLCVMFCFMIEDILIIGGVSVMLILSTTCYPPRFCLSVTPDTRGTHMGLYGSPFTSVASVYNTNVTYG